MGENSYIKTHQCGIVRDGNCRCQSYPARCAGTSKSILNPLAIGLAWLLRYVLSGLRELSDVAFLPFSSPLYLVQPDTFNKTVIVLPILSWSKDFCFSQTTVFVVVRAVWKHEMLVIAPVFGLGLGRFFSQFSVLFILAVKRSPAFYRSFCICIPEKYRYIKKVK